MDEPTADECRRSMLVWGGTVGVALGAIVDVVVFHLIVQQHHLLSGYVDPHSYAGLRTNVAYDGLFLAAMLGVAFVGLVMVWRTVNGTTRRLSGRFLGGAILIGAGMFNLFDGVVTHYVLGLHDVVHDTQAWNPHWIAVSLVLLGVGFVTLYSARGATESNDPARSRR